MTLANRTLIVAFAALVLGAPVAHAQSAAAEALFREGRTLIKQGNLKAGCDKLEASEKIESSVGTLLNLGDCRERQGRFASAWAAFRKAEAMARREGNDIKREREARRRAVALEGDLASITVQVGAKSRTDGLVIKRDGEVVDSALWGNAIVVDPGSHTVIAEAPGKKPWRSDISIGKGGKRWVVIPTLESDAPVAITPPPAPPPRVVVDAQPAPSTVTVVPEPRTVVTTSTWTTARKASVVVGILGLGAVGAGVYFGTQSNDLQAQSDAICPTTVCDDPQGLALNDRAQDNAMRANVLFVAGGGAVVAATVMWFIGAPDEHTVISPTVTDTHVGAAVTGRF